MTDVRSFFTPAMLLAGLVLSCVFFFATPAGATPFHSAASARSCTTCHIDPIGWENPALRLRKCTLDCSGCHVGSTGGGMRKPAGSYYGLESLATFGSRPSKNADPEKYREPGDTTETPTRFRIWEGFSGWKAGETPMEEIPDRFGTIPPDDPRFRIGGDFRVLGYFPDQGESAIFPMQTDVYLMGKATDHLRMYATLGYLGRRTREPEEIRNEKIKTLVAMREVFAQVDGLPYNLYARAGRFNKPYGWRIPDHTSFMRRDAGFDQDAQAFGVEVGLNPNYPYANLALFYQGASDWPGDRMPYGYGTAFTAGYRNLLGQAGMSFQFLDLLDGGHELTAGPLWALNAYPFVYLGQVDFRTQMPEFSYQKTNNQLFAYHEVRAYVVQGLSLQLKYDWMDPNLRTRNDHRDRYTIGVKWNPYGRLSFVLQRRWMQLAGEQSARDVLFMTHYWF